MPHRTVVEEASRKRGRKISPEIIEELLGFAGPGAIKRIAGLPGLGLRLEGKAISRPAGQAAEDLGQNTDTIKQLIKQRRRKLSKANIDRPNTIAGGERRANVGGQRPPDTELEALALNKQQGLARIRAKKEFFERESTRTINDPASQKELVELRKEFFRLGEEGVMLNDLSIVKRLIARVRELESSVSPPKPKGTK